MRYLVTVAICIIVIAFTIAIIDNASCSHKGGVMVRGTFSNQCVKLEKL